MRASILPYNAQANCRKCRDIGNDLGEISGCAHIAVCETASKQWVGQSSQRFVATALYALAVSSSGRASRIGDAPRRDCCEWKHPKHKAADIHVGFRYP
jgi:hypothetical protein